MPPVAPVPKAPALAVGRAPAPKAGPSKGSGRGGPRNAPPPAPNYNSSLYQPGQQLSGKSLDQAAHGIANAQTQGPLSELAAQIARQDQQGAAAQKTTMGYYMQLAKDAQAAYGQMQGVNSGLTNQLNGTELTTASAIQGLGQQAQSGAMSRLSGMGLGGDSSQMLANQTAQNQATGALNYGNYRSAWAMQNANYSDHALGAIQAQGLRGQERIGNMAQATRLANAPLNAKEAALIANKGALYSNALGTLRTQERNYQVAQAGLGIRQTTNSITAANDVAKNALTARGQNITSATAAANRQSQALIAAANRAQSDINNARTTGTSAANNAASNSTRVLVAQMQAAARGGTKPASVKAAQTIFDHVSYVSGLLNQLIGSSTDPNQAVKAYHLLQNGGRVQTGTNASGKPTYKYYAPLKLGTEILNLAYNTRNGGSGPSPGDIAWLKSMGIFNPTRYGPVNTTGGNISQGGANSPH